MRTASKPTVIQLTRDDERWLQERRKNLHVHLTREDENWLQERRKEQKKHPHEHEKKARTINSIVARFKRADTEPLKPPSSEADWNTWVDEVHEGGKKKVPNPSATSRKLYPEVEFSTALKDKAFYQNAVKQYQAWKKERSPQETGEKEHGDKTEPVPDSEAPKPAPYTKIFSVTDDEVTAAAKEHTKDFDEVVKNGRERIRTFNYSHLHEKSDVAQREWRNLSEAEKLIHVMGHEIGKKFEASLTPDESAIHSRFCLKWRVGPDEPSSFEMMGAVSSMGVDGSPAPGDDNAGAETERSRGAKDEALKAYARKAWLYQQAFFKHMGVKELTLYRGLKRPPADIPEDGGHVTLKARELSSFSADPQVAIDFGRPMKFKVPVDRVLASSLICPDIGSDVIENGMYGDHKQASWGEDELIIMGTSSLEGEMLQRKYVETEEEKAAKAKEKAKIIADGEGFAKGVYKGRLSKELDIKAIQKLRTSSFDDYTKFVKDTVDSNDLDTLRSEKDKLTIYTKTREVGVDAWGTSSDERRNALAFGSFLSDVVFRKEEQEKKKGEAKLKADNKVNELFDPAEGKYKGKLHKELDGKFLQHTYDMWDIGTQTQIVKDIVKDNDLATLKEERGKIQKMKDSMTALPFGIYNADETNNVNIIAKVLDTAYLQKKEDEEPYRLQLHKSLGSDDIQKAKDSKDTDVYKNLVHEFADENYISNLQNEEERTRKTQDKLDSDAKADKKAELKLIHEFMQDVLKERSRIDDERIEKSFEGVGGDNIKKGLYKGKLHKALSAKAIKEMNDKWSSGGEAKYNALVQNLVDYNDLDTLAEEKKKLEALSKNTEDYDLKPNLDMLRITVSAAWDKKNEKAKVEKSLPKESLLFDPKKGVYQGKLHKELDAKAINSYAANWDHGGKDSYNSILRDFGLHNPIDTLKAEKSKLTDFMGEINAVDPKSHDYTHSSEERDNVAVLRAILDDIITDKTKKTPELDSTDSKEEKPADSGVADNLAEGRYKGKLHKGLDSDVIYGMSTTGYKSYIKDFADNNTMKVLKAELVTLKKKIKDMADSGSKKTLNDAMLLEDTLKSAILAKGKPKPKVTKTAERVFERYKALFQ